MLDHLQTEGRNPSSSNLDELTAATDLKGTAST